MSPHLDVSKQVADVWYRPALVIDCAEVGKAKNDGALISALADQTGKSCREGEIGRN